MQKADYFFPFLLFIKHKKTYPRSTIPYFVNTKLNGCQAYSLTNNRCSIYKLHDNHAYNRDL